MKRGEHCTHSCASVDVSISMRCCSVGLWYEWFVKNEGISNENCLVFAHRSEASDKAAWPRKQMITPCSAGHRNDTICFSQELEERQGRGHKLRCCVRFNIPLTVFQRHLTFAWCILSQVVKGEFDKFMRSVNASKGAAAQKK